MQVVRIRQDVLRLDIRAGARHCAGKGHPHGAGIHLGIRDGIRPKAQGRALPFLDDAV